MNKLFSLIGQMNFFICSNGEFQILEVDPWIGTPILVDIGTFEVHLLTYVLIKYHLKGVPIPISDKDECIRIGHTLNIYI